MEGYKSSKHFTAKEVITCIVFDKSVYAEFDEDIVGNENCLYLMLHACLLHSPANKTTVQRQLCQASAQTS